MAPRGKTGCCVAALAAAALAAGCAHRAAAPVAHPAPAAPQQVVAAARAAIEQWRQAYEVRSFDALAALYAQDRNVVVVVDGQPLVGWPAVSEMLRARLGHAKEIHVRLEGVKVTSLAPRVADATAIMTREVGDGVTTVTEQGALTLVLRRGAHGWKIVMEHYSHRTPG